MTADGTPITESKIIRISQEHIYVDGVCGYGETDPDYYMVFVPVTTTVMLGDKGLP